MTQTELRIGNFVSAKTTSESFNIISEIGDGGSGRGWYVRLENVNHGVWLEHDGRFLIEGIEITEEWLVKLGFEKQKGIYRSFYQSNDNNYLSICFDDDRYYFMDVNEDPSFSGFNYVHQLQNLYFALTGTELDYENETK